jgi:hypothetical protein
MQKNAPNLTDFYDKFQFVAKNIEGFWFFSIFIYIWLNHCHFSCVTKLKKEPLMAKFLCFHRVVKNIEG